MGSFAAGLDARVRIPGAVPAVLPPRTNASDFTGDPNVEDFGTFVWADAPGGSLARAHSNSSKDSTMTDIETLLPVLTQSGQPDTLFKAMTTHSVPK